MVISGDIGVYGSEDTSEDAVFRQVSSAPLMQSYGDLQYDNHQQSELLHVIYVKRHIAR